MLHEKNHPGEPETGMPAIPFEQLEQTPFTEPWHAQLFALTIRMAQEGRFTWPQWSAVFVRNLAQASENGAPKDASHYYDIWLESFEEFLLNENFADAKKLQEIKAAWTLAYLETPHGDPVKL